MRHFRLFRLLAVGLCVAVLTTAAADTALAADKPPSIPSRPVPSPAPTASRSPSPRVAPIKAPGPTTGQAVGKESRVAAEYWTAARMAAAKPLGYKPLGRRAKASSGLAAGAPPGTPASEHFSGTPVVGTFFAHGPTGTDWYCTGSVIDSSTRNIVLTAGHCGLGLNGGNYIFVPKFTMGAGPDQQPFGIFKVQHLFMDARYGPSQTSLPVSDLDTAFARVAPNQFGKQLQDAVQGAHLHAAERLHQHGSDHWVSGQLPWQQHRLCRPMQQASGHQSTGRIPADADDLRRLFRWNVGEPVDRRLEPDHAHRQSDRQSRWQRRRWQQ